MEKVQVKLNSPKPNRIKFKPRSSPQSNRIKVDMAIRSNQSRKIPGWKDAEIIANSQLLGKIVDLQSKQEYF